MNAYESLHPSYMAMGQNPGIFFFNPKIAGMNGCSSVHPSEIDNTIWLFNIAMEHQHF
jgi:hypothetical protein